MTNVISMSDRSINVVGWIGGHSNIGYDGEGFYIWPSEYPDEGALRFDTLEEAIGYASENPEI